MEEDRLLTVEQAAGRLAMGRSQFYTLLRKGRIPSLSLGRSRRVRASDLQRFIVNEADRQGIAAGS